MSIIPLCGAFTPHSIFPQFSRGRPAFFTDESCVYTRTYHQPSTRPSVQFHLRKPFHSPGFVLHHSERGIQHARAHVGGAEGTQSD